MTLWRRAGYTLGFAMHFCFFQELMEFEKIAVTAALSANTVGL